MPHLRPTAPRRPVADRPRILVVGPATPPVHGVSVMTETVVAALRRAGWEVGHVDTADRRGLENIGRLDVGNVVLGLRHMVEIWWAALRLRPALLLLPLSQAPLPVLRDALWVAVPCLLGARLVLHLHGSALGQLARDGPPWCRWLLRRLGRRAACALVLTPAAARNFDGLVPPHRVQVLENGIADPGPPPPRPASDGLRVLYLANLAVGKGYLTVLRAVERLAAAVPGVRVTLAGAWYDGQKEARALLATPAVGAHVEMAGVVQGERKARLLEAAEVFVFPPGQPEGQPLVLLEAMAAGLPIVTTRSGSIPETVAEGENALLVPADDPAALTEAIAGLAANPARRAAMGAASRRRYEARYSLGAFATRLDHLLRAALREP